MDRPARPPDAEVTPRERQIEEAFRTRERQVERFVEMHEKLGDDGWFAYALIESQRLASGRPDDPDAWKRQSVPTFRVREDLSNLVMDPPTITEITEALERLRDAGLVRSNSLAGGGDGIHWWWAAEWVPT